MQLKTLRFGEIEIDPDQIIYFSWGLPGFPEQKRYVPIHYRQNSGLFFLQAVDLPELTFIIADPFQIVPDYVVDIPAEDLLDLGIRKQEEAAVYVILTLRQGGREITANLLAPLVINTANNTGRQIILFNSHYSPRVTLNIQPQAAAK